MVITMVNFKIFKKKETIQQELQLFSLFSSFVRQSLVTPLANRVFKPNECCRSFGVLVESQQKDTWNSISCSFPQTSEHFAYKTKKMKRILQMKTKQTPSKKPTICERLVCIYGKEQTMQCTSLTNKCLSSMKWNGCLFRRKKKRGEQREILKKTYGLG